MASSSSTALVEYDIAQLKPYPGNARTHSKKQIGLVTVLCRSPES